jgi:hypothetical protein
LKQVGTLADMKRTMDANDLAVELQVMDLVAAGFTLAEIVST